MTELIKITETKGTKSVSARELYSGLIEGSERFSKWWNRMIGYGYVDGIDYKSGAYQKVQSNQYGGEKLLEDYEITIQMAKELCMIQKNEKGKKFRQYFIECEKQLRNVEQIPEVKPYVARVESAKLLHEIAKEYSGLSQTYKQILDAHATKEITGEFLLPLPLVERKTYSATEIGEKLGISANKVGKIAKENNLKTKEFGKWVVDKARNSNKEIETFRYYDSVVTEIEKYIG